MIVEPTYTDMGLDGDYLIVFENEDIDELLRLIKFSGLLENTQITAAISEYLQKNPIDFKGCTVPKGSVFIEAVVQDDHMGPSWTPQSEETMELILIFNKRKDKQDD